MQEFGIRVSTLLSCTNTHVLFARYAYGVHHNFVYYYFYRFYLHFRFTAIIVRNARVSYTMSE